MPKGVAGEPMIPAAGEMPMHVPSMGGHMPPMPKGVAGEPAIPGAGEMPFHMPSMGDYGSGGHGSATSRGHGGVSSGKGGH